MGLLDRYRQAPPSLFGRRAATARRWASRTQPSPVCGRLAGATSRDDASPRSRPHYRADRRRPSGRRPRPGRHRADAGRQGPAELASGRTHRHPPAQRTGAAVLAVRGPRKSRHCYRIAVRRIPDGGGGSIEMHDLAVGASVTTHGPRNAFPLTVPGYGSPARRFRFIAAGIGITPILPMLDLAQSLGVDWSMVYAGRSRDSLPFVDEVSRFGDRIADPHRRHQRPADGRRTARRLPRRHRRLRMRSCADADGDSIRTRGPGQRRVALRAVRRAAGRRRQGVHGLRRLNG